jgi:hypothetical protein
MTVVQLTESLTQEELVGWAAFFEIKAEQEEKSIQNAKSGRGARTMGSR